MRDRKVLPEKQRRERRDDEPRTHRVNLRLGDDEMAAVQAAAKFASLTPSSYAARTVVAVAMGTLTPIPTTTREELGELVEAREQLGRIGNNLNQIARTLNSNGEITAEQLRAVMERVEQAARRVDEATIVNMRRRRRSV